MQALLDKLKGLKLPLLILAVGLLLLLWPGQSKTAEPGPDGELEALLSRVEGVGEAQALVSEHGVLIVCEGADSAAVKLDILRAVASYTGFGSDKVTILKLSENKETGRKGK